MIKSLNRQLENKIKKIFNKKESLLIINIIQNLTTKKKKGKLSFIRYKATELFNNLNLFLNLLEENQELKQDLLDTIHNAKDNKLDIFIDFLNKTTPFDIIKDKKFNTASGGIPDSSFFIKYNNKEGYRILYSASSDSASVAFEGIQQVKHSIKLQLSLNKALDFFKGEEYTEQAFLEKKTSHKPSPFRAESSGGQF